LASEVFSNIAGSIAAVSAGSIAVPHCPQNLLPAGISELQEEQIKGNFAPQEPQNLLPCGLSELHDGHSNESVIKPAVLFLFP